MKHNILKVIFALLSITLAANSYAENVSPEKEKKTKRLLREEVKGIDYGKRRFLFNIKVNQRGDFWDSKLENSFRYRLYVAPDFKLQISENFYARAWFGLGVTKGSVQSRFGDLRTRNTVRLRDSRFMYRKSWDDRRHWLRLSIGALNQRSFLKERSLDILMSRRALPGLEQIYKYENKYRDQKSYGFDIRFFEGIPTSESISLDFNEKEDMPFYYNGKLELFIKDMNMNENFGYRAGLHVGVFDFSTLPASIADESRLFGNTVNGIGAASEFVYDYKGWYAGWSTILSYKRWEFKPFIDILTNTEAPSGRNQGQNYGAQIKYHDHSFYSIELEPFTFFNESDASVASYNGFTAGHNNREGYGMNLAVELPRRSLKFNLSYVYTDVLEENADLQVPYHFVGFKMEYRHEL